MAYATVNITDKTIDNIIKVNGLYDVLSNLPNSFKLFNICLNSLKWNDLPRGYETYILGFWHEVFDENWFIQQYNKNPNSMFIILGDFNPNDLTLYSRVKFFKILHWKYYVPSSNYSDINWTDKVYKISSLSYYVNEYRFFITSHLLNRENVLFSYHNKYREGTCLPTEKDGSTPIRDSLIETKKYLDNNVFLIDAFANDPMDVYQKASSHPAYRNSLVNSINETKDISYTDSFGICPGPYLTEKTWKPLSSGVALLFSSQMNTKKVLEDIGFIFEYPWDNSYSNLWQDAERLEIILNTIDKIMGMTHKEIEIAIKESCEYNAMHIRSNSFLKNIDLVNQHGLAKIEDNL